MPVVTQEINQDYSTCTASRDVVTETDDGHGNIMETTATVTETTLYITVSHKTADEMAVFYNFTADQRQQLAELLAEENRSMWSAVLYGIGAGDGEIVVVALSQIWNVGGQPYMRFMGTELRPIKGPPLHSGGYIKFQKMFTFTTLIQSAQPIIIV